jgi:hypothetical protein
LATWALWRLQVADSREHDALKHIDAAHEWRWELNVSLVQVREECDNLHEILARLAEKEDEMMSRELALQLVLEHPPLPNPFIDLIPLKASIPPFIPLLLPLTLRMTLTLWRDYPICFPVRGFEKYKVFGVSKRLEKYNCFRAGQNA